MPAVSVVVLSWDKLDLTTECVESLRQGTQADLEVIIVDNGSQPDVQAVIPQLADKWILNSENKGFSTGMNQGLELADSPVVVFANNDTVFPAGWDTLLIESLTSLPHAGLVVPAVTASGNPSTVRNEPGSEIERLLPFSEPPSGIVYVMKTESARRLGGWSTDYRIAAGEDWDLCFTLWLNGLDIYFDTRVLIEHVSKGTAADKLEDWQSLWRENRNRFLDKWSGDLPAPVLDGFADAAFRTEALTVAMEWMRQFYSTRDDLLSLRDETNLLRRRVLSLEKKLAAMAPRATLSFQLKAVPSRLLRKTRHLARRFGGSGPDKPE